MIKGIFILLLILACLVLPLFLFYKIRGWSEKSVRLSLTLIPILWYFTNAPLHEFGHMVATYMVGGTITEVVLFPKFWEGSFGNAYIHSTGVIGSMNFAITSLFPYLIDVLFLVAGYFILKTSNIKSAFMSGFILMLFFLRPLFDIISNTSVALLFQVGDFVQLAEHIETLPTITIGLALSTLALYMVIFTIKNSPTARL
jgi:hypothetical protein